MFIAQRPYLAALILAIIPFAIYANNLTGPFIFDDYDSIIDNPGFNKPQSPLSGRPVVTLTFRLNYALGGLNVRGYHAGNILIHAFCAVALLAVLRQIFARVPQFAEAAGGLAFACALIWTVHPLMSEPVNYITQRTESLMSLFYLLTIYAALRAIDGPPAWRIASVIACALGMLCKESMVTAPVAVLLLDYYIARDAMRRRLPLYAMLAATWIIVAAIMIMAPRGLTVRFDYHVTWLDYALRQCWAILHYLYLVVYPYPLSVDYGHVNPIAIVNAVPHAIGLLVILTVTAWLAIKRHLAGLTLAWFFLLLAPTSSIVPIVSEVAAERRAYLAAVGIIVLIVCIARQFVAPRWRSVALKLTILVLCIMTVQRNRDYRSQESVWSSAVAAVPDNPRALRNHASLLAQREQYRRAIELFERALDIRSNDPVSLTYLGGCYAATGNLEGAVRVFTEAIRLDPDNTEAREGLAAVLQALGREDARISAPPN